MNVFDKPEVLQEIDGLKSTIATCERSAEALTRKRKATRKRMKGPLSLLLALLFVTLLTSSCSLHAGELLGYWDVDPLVEGVTAYLQGYLDQAKDAGNILYVIASFLMAAVTLPMRLLIMPIAVLRIIAEVLSMTFPAALPFLGYVEIALVLLSFITAIREVGLVHHNRKIRSELATIDSKIRDRRDMARSAEARIEELKGTEKYRTACDEWAKIAPWAEAHRKAVQEGRTLDASRIEYIVQYLPKQVDLALLEPYVKEDLGRAQEAVKMAHYDFRWMDDSKVDDFMAEIDRVFHALET